jgi:hypothetical protein
MKCPGANSKEWPLGDVLRVNHSNKCPGVFWGKHYSARERHKAESVVRKLEPSFPNPANINWPFQYSLGPQDLNNCNWICSLRTCKIPSQYDNSLPACQAGIQSPLLSINPPGWHLVMAKLMTDASKLNLQSKAHDELHSSGERFCPNVAVEPLWK